MTSDRCWMIVFGRSADSFEDRRFFESDRTMDATSKGNVKLCFPWDTVTSMGVVISVLFWPAPVAFRRVTT